MIREDILNHTRREYPRECCGVVIKDHDTLVYRACRNIAHGDAEFVLHPDDHAIASQLGCIVAIVHSHPDGTTDMSPADKFCFESSEVDWMIASWPEGRIKIYSAISFKG